MESARSSNVKRFKGENDGIKEIKIRANLEELENARGLKVVSLRAPVYRSQDRVNRGVGETLRSRFDFKRIKKRAFPVESFQD